MTLLVVGATGTVGGEVVHALVERGAEVRALVRSKERARRALPSSVELAAGDVRDRASLERAIEGVDAMFYVSPHEADEEALAQTVLEVCEARGVRLVFFGVHADGANRLSRGFKRLALGLLLPHYAPKLRISERVRRSRTKTSVILSTNFFQNDELFRDSILGGEFVTPLSAKGINRVDVRDIGEGVARVLLDPTLAAPVVPIVGSVAFSGAESAAVWSRVLGREVRYTGEDFARFERDVVRVLEGRKREDILASYRALGKLHVPTEAAQLAATTALLGRPPRAYEDYVRDVSARWARQPGVGSAAPIGVERAVERDGQGLVEEQLR